MASLHPFLMRMHSTRNRTRRRRLSSTTSSISNHLADANNNELFGPIIAPSRKRRKISACIYKAIPPADDEVKDASKRSPQLAVHLFEGCPINLRNEETIPMSTERFLSFGRLYCQDGGFTSMAYYAPRMVPVSIVTTSYPCYDAALKTETINHCTTIEFRRRYSLVATQTVDNDHKKEDTDQQPSFVSYACWNVSEY